MKSLELPPGEVQRLISSLNRDLRVRKKQGAPDDEHPTITLLWSHLLYIAHVCEILTAYGDAAIAGASELLLGREKAHKADGMFIVGFDRTMRRNSVPTLAEFAITLYKALTAENPDSIPDPILRDVIRSARIQKTVTVLEPEAEA